MTETALVCANHGDRITHLRCNRCEKPICSKCAILTPVGYRCRECVEGVRKGFDTALPLDYPVAAGLSAAGGGVTTYFLGFLGLWGLLLAPIAGGALAEVVRWAVRRRRGQRLPLAAAAGGALGALTVAVGPSLFLLSFFRPGAEGWASLGIRSLWPLLQGFLVVSALFYRLRGIRL